MRHASRFAVTFFEAYVTFLVVSCVEQVEVSVWAVSIEVDVVSGYDTAGRMGAANVGGGT
jgi:hypothetical protein